MTVAGPAVIPTVGAQRFENTSVMSHRHEGDGDEHKEKLHCSAKCHLICQAQREGRKKSIPSDLLLSHKIKVYKRGPFFFLS